MFESPAKKQLRERNERTAEAKAIAERLEAAKMATMLPGNRLMAERERERLTTAPDVRREREIARVAAARLAEKSRQDAQERWQRLRAAAKAAASGADAAVRAALEAGDLEEAATQAARAAAMRSLQVVIDDAVRRQFAGVPFINTNAALVV